MSKYDISFSTEQFIPNRKDRRKLEAEYRHNFGKAAFNKIRSDRDAGRLIERELARNEDDTKHEN